MRPLPPPFRSERTLRVRSPVISYWPEPASLLVTEIILDFGCESQISLAAAEIVIGIILWLGGERMLGLAVRLVMSGGVVSRTVTTVDCVTRSDCPSFTTTITCVGPS